MTLPVEVIEAARARRCLLFLGSHASREAASESGQPWPSERELALALGWRPPRQVPGARARAVTPSFQKGAELTQTAQGRSGLLRELQRLLPTAHLSPQPSHRVAVRAFPLIFTTCIDRLIERAGVEQGLSMEGRVVDRTGEIPPLDPVLPTLVRMRGSLEAPDSLVLLPEDTRLQPWTPASRRRLRDLFKEKVLFFVGFRPDEEEFELFWEDLTDAYGGELPRVHLAVASGGLDDFLWQRWVWRGVHLFTAEPSECLQELGEHVSSPSQER